MKESILRKAESAYGKEPWTITTVHPFRIQMAETKGKELISEE
jgi:hypothetical protein